MSIKKTRSFTIGICGGSGSGKTTLLRRISEAFKSKTPAVFSMDNYYHSIEEQHRDQNNIVNFDLPTALNEKQLTQDFHALAAGNVIEVKEYFFNAPPDKNVLLTIQPSELLIVEGLFLFHYEGVKERLDFSVYVDVDHETQLDRRIYRDQETRGYSREDIIYQWDNHVIPCYENYILPYKESADFIFRNDHRSEEDFDIMLSALKEKMKL
jgi:uridine kinase